MPKIVQDKTLFPQMVAREIQTQLCFMVAHWRRTSVGSEGIARACGQHGKGQLGCLLPVRPPQQTLHKRQLIQQHDSMVTGSLTLCSLNQHCTRGRLLSRQGGLPIGAKAANWSKCKRLSSAILTHAPFAASHRIWRLPDLTSDCLACNPVMTDALVVSSLVSKTLHGKHAYGQYSIVL